MSRYVLAQAGKLSFTGLVLSKFSIDGIPHYKLEVAYNVVNSSAPHIKQGTTIDLPVSCCRPSGILVKERRPVRRQARYSLAFIIGFFVILGTVFACAHLESQRQDKLDHYYNSMGWDALEAEYDYK